MPTEQQKYSIKQVELLSSLPDINREPRFRTKVKANIKITKDVFTLSLERPAEFKFTPGQYVWLVLPECSKYSGIIDRRAYSIASSTDNLTIDLLINVTESDFLKKVKALKTDEYVDIIGPMGSSFEVLADGAVMLAGGTGISPFLSILRSHMSKNLTLIAYSRKEKGSLHFERELKELSEKYNYKINLKKTGPQKSDFRHIIGKEHIEPIFISGSQGFIDFVTDLLIDSGIESNRLHYEEHYPSTKISKDLQDEFTNFYFGDWSNSVQKFTGINDMFLEVVKQSHNYVVLTNHDGHILYANQSAINLSGFTFTEMQGQTPRLWGGLMPAESYKQQWSALRRGNAVKRFAINRRRDGSLYTAIVTTTPILHKGVFMVTEENITTLREVDRSKTEFVSIASHQLRTPLSVIKWYVEMLINGDAGKLSEKQSEYLKEVYAGSERMVELVNLLLDASRLELGTFKITRETIDSVELTKSVIDEQKILIEQKKMNVSITSGNNIPKIQADPKLLRMVIQNLLSNAIKYTPEKGTIKIDFVINKNNDFVVKVADNGYGIPKSQQDKIFSKFFRADNVRLKSTEGTGLGLYIVKLIIDNYGGRIWFESEENKGTTFYISLPVETAINKEKESGITI